MRNLEYHYYYHYTRQETKASEGETCNNHILSVKKEKSERILIQLS